MKPPKKGINDSRVQKRTINWDEFERLTGRPRPGGPAPPEPAAPPEPEVPQPVPEPVDLAAKEAEAFDGLLAELREKPTQQMFGQVIQTHLATMGMSQARAAVLLGFKNRGHFGNLLHARGPRWTAERLNNLMALLKRSALALAEDLRTK